MWDFIDYVDKKIIVLNLQMQSADRESEEKYMAVSYVWTLNEVTKIEQDNKT